MSTEPTDAAIWPEGYDRIHLERVDSTMKEAARLAPELKRPTWILADMQTGARGRMGRPWHMPAGNFAATLLMRPDGTAAQAALRSFFTANALFETLAMSIDRTKLSLKWPNDVLLNGGKIAGILLESAGRGDGVDWLAIGVGVNLKAIPSDVKDAAFAPVSLLGEGGAEVTPAAFLDVLAAHFATEEAIYAELGFDPIRTGFLKRAARLGEVITARTARDDITGVFDTIDAQGNLILKTAEGLIPVPAADVYF